MKQDSLLCHGHGTDQVFVDLGEDVFEGLVRVEGSGTIFNMTNLLAGGAAPYLLSNRKVAAIRGLTDREQENPAHTNVPHVQPP